MGQKILHLKKWQGAPMDSAYKSTQVRRSAAWEHFHHGNTLDCVALCRWVAGWWKFLGFFKKHILKFGCTLAPGKSQSGLLVNSGRREQTTDKMILRSSAPRKMEKNFLRTRSKRFKFKSYLASSSCQCQWAAPGDIIQKTFFVFDSAGSLMPHWCANVQSWLWIASHVRNCG